MWITRDPIGYAGGVGLYEYASGAPTGALDAFGLEDVDVHIFNIRDAQGGLAGMRVQELTNCLGYACRANGGLYPRGALKGVKGVPDEVQNEKPTALAPLLSKLGYRCEKGISALDCKSHCSCDDWIMLYYYTITKDKAKAAGVLKKYVGKDLIQDPNALYESDDLDYHALRGEGSGYKYQPNSAPAAQQNVMSFNPTQDSPDFSSFDGRIAAKYCCCRKKA